MGLEQIEKLQCALAHAQRPSSDFDLNAGGAPFVRQGELRAAAVLILFEERDGTWFVHLTKRPSTMRHHPGQIAFPGGKKDDADTSLLETALREAREELGLDTHYVTTLGRLPSHETITGFLIEPIVAYLTGPKQTYSRSEEVAEHFIVPFAHLMTIATYSVQSRQWRGQERRYYVVPYGPYYIWGATARICYSLAHAYAQGGYNDVKNIEQLAPLP